MYESISSAGVWGHRVWRRRTCSHQDGSTSSCGSVRSCAMASTEGDSRQSSNGRIVSRRAGADNGPNPAVRQRELGMRRRELRDGLGLTVDHVAKQLECSATKVSRLETEARRASLRVVPDLCGIYRVTDLTDVDDLMNLARQAPEHRWWTRYDDLNLSTYIGQEQEAVAITSFSMYYVPPLIQTSDYARVIIKGIVPKMDPEMIDQRVEARFAASGCWSENFRCTIVCCSMRLSCTAIEAGGSSGRRSFTRSCGALRGLTAGCGRLRGRTSQQSVPGALG